MLDKGIATFPKMDIPSNEIIDFHNSIFVVPNYQIFTKVDTVGRRKRALKRLSVADMFMVSNLDLWQE
jgi:hypothetical protein